MAEPLRVPPYGRHFREVRSLRPLDVEGNVRAPGGGLNGDSKISGLWFMPGS